MAVTTLSTIFTIIAQSDLFVGTFPSEALLNTAVPTALEGQTAIVDAGSGSSPTLYGWDITDEAWTQLSGPGGTMTDAEIKTAYQNEVPLVSQVVAEAGTGTSIESWSPLRVKQSIDALAPGISGAGHRTIISIDNTGLVDITAALKTALELGGAQYLPAGSYLIGATGPDSGGVVATLTSSLDLLLDPDAVILGDTNLDNAAITIIPDKTTVDAGGEISVKFSGGKTDGSGMRNSTSIPYETVYPPANLGTSAVTDLLNFRGQLGSAAAYYDGFTSVVVEDHTFYAGDHWEIAGSDSGVFVNGSAYTSITKSRFYGIRDQGIYVSGGDDTSLDGHNGFFSGNYFENCFGGISAKRAYRLFLLEHNEFKNCVWPMGIAILTTEATRGSISNNVANQWQVGVRLDEGQQISVTDNTFIDAGWFLNSGAMPAVTDMSYAGGFDEAIGIHVDNSSRCFIADNFISGRAAGYDNVTNPSWGIRVSDTASRNTVTENTIINLTNPITEDAACSNNKFILNTAHICTNDVSLLSTTRQAVEMRDTGFLRVDAPSVVGATYFDTSTVPTVAAVTWKVRFAGLNDGGGTSIYSSIESAASDTATGVGDLRFNVGPTAQPLRIHDYKIECAKVLELHTIPTTSLPTASSTPGGIMVDSTKGWPVYSWGGVWKKFVDKLYDFYAIQTWDPPSLAAGATMTTPVTVTGAALGDRVECSFSLDLQRVTLHPYVSAANTVTIAVHNTNISTVDLGSGSLRVWVTTKN